MKIQSTTTKSAPAAGTKKSSQASGSFKSLFASKVQHEPHAEQHPQQSPSNAPTTPQVNVEDTLHALEEVIRNLDSDPQAHRQAQNVISKLRQALTQHSNLSEQDRQEVDTILAVESKRLEALKR